MGWEALRLWGKDADRIERLAGGVANDVWSAFVASLRLAGSAAEATLICVEAGLLQHLDRQGLAVPVPIPAMDGRLFAGGLMVMTFVEGGPPGTGDDWRRVADTLRESASGDAGVAATPGLAIVDGSSQRRDRDKDRPHRDAVRGRCAMPRRVGAPRRP